DNLVSFSKQESIEPFIIVHADELEHISIWFRDGKKHFKRSKKCGCDEYDKDTNYKRRGEKLHFPDECKIFEFFKPSYKTHTYFNTSSEDHIHVIVDVIALVHPKTWSSCLEYSRSQTNLKHSRLNAKPDCSHK